jgi:hypothetical protein
MQTSPPIRVELSEFEQALLEQIDFDAEPGYLIAQASGKASRQLMESLIRRDAIPAARRAWFTEPFPGGRGKSPMQVLQGKQSGNRHIFEDPRFVQHYLRYFINGPDLPESTVGRFCELAAEGSIDRLRSFVRREARASGGGKRLKTADEFYKLALECFPDDPRTQRSIRAAAMRAR